MLLENKIWMVGNLTHLHDQPKNIGIVVEHDTPADVGIELSRRVGHNAAGEIMLDFAEEFIVQGDSNVIRHLALHAVGGWGMLSTHRLGGSSKDEVCSCFIRRSMI